MPKVNRTTSNSKCQIVAQAILAGIQTVRIRVFWRHDGWDTPYISLRIGGLLLNIEDHAALDSLREAVRHADHVAEQAFGPRFR
jgi:hypothetical protein